MGSGPALLILHGLFGSLDNWLSHAKILSEEFTVHLLDQRNHGRSPHADEWNYPLMAEDLLAYMDSEGITTASLLGHSMGGKTALTFADAYPERLEKLIIADITPKPYKPHHDEIIEALQKAVDDLAKPKASDEKQTYRESRPEHLANVRNNVNSAAAVRTSGGAVKRMYLRPRNWRQRPVGNPGKYEPGSWFGFAR